MDIGRISQTAQNSTSMYVDDVNVYGETIFG